MTYRYPIVSSTDTCPIRIGRVFSIREEFQVPSSFPPHQNLQMALSILSQTLRGILKQLITYVGIDCMTALIRTPLPEKERFLFFQPFNLVLIRSTRNLKTWLLDLPMWVGSPRYLGMLLEIWIGRNE